MKFQDVFLSLHDRLASRALLFTHWSCMEQLITSPVQPFYRQARMIRVHHLAAQALDLSIDIEQLATFTAPEENVINVCRPQVQCPPRALSCACD